MALVDLARSEHALDDRAGARIGVIDHGAAVHPRRRPVRQHTRPDSTQAAHRYRPGDIPARQADAGSSLCLPQGRDGEMVAHYQRSRDQERVDSRSSLEITRWSPARPLAWPGREPINLPGGQFARVRYAPIPDQIPHRSELTLCAICGLMQCSKKIANRSPHRQSRGALAEFRCRALSQS
jgi:hypothetical protein